MDKIASFQINHLLLNPGIYVSRKDMAGDQVLTTFDITKSIRTRLYILDLWAVVRDFISYFPVTMSQRI